MSESFEKIKFSTRSTPEEVTLCKDEVEIVKLPINFENELETIRSLLNDQDFEIRNLNQRINRQADLLGKQQEEIDNYIDVKAKLDGKIAEYSTKSNEYELSACSCGARINGYRKEALENLKEELFE